ncbi:Hsp20/alpha crystallin family protein [Bacillus dakarensis]|uniref:Hsp20/alpha crystallin family protein n=1 Tax=Robertmurraya dakarensis TaxID=1926278 RepID=UPI000981C5B2|nr:Hsp20/alpha crystallin family protein [Bacillus dakarensis]
MDLEKLKEWLEVANLYQQGQFWNVYQQKDGQSGSSAHVLQEIFPRCDVYDFENNLILEAELPGVSANEIEVTVENGQLVLKGECKTLKSTLQYYLKERPNRKFEKTITLPYPVESSKKKCSYKDGIFTIHLPKKKQEKSVLIPIVE